MSRWTLNESTPVVVGADRSASWSLQQLYVLALRTAISTTTAYLACTRYRAKKGGLLGELRVLLCRAGYIQPLCHQTGNSFRLFAPAWSLWSLTSSVVPMHSANLHATLQGRLAVNSHGIQYVLVVVVYGFQSMRLLLCVMMASGVYMMYTASVFSARSCKIFEALLPRHWVFSVL